MNILREDGGHFSNENINNSNEKTSVANNSGEKTLLEFE